jgi:hypothetical protein
MHRFRQFVCALVWLACSALAAASPYRGVVTFGGLPLPGATVTATQGTTKLTAISDANGEFQFDDLGDGKWTIGIQMQLFAPVHADVTIAPNLPGAAYEMKLLDPTQIQASAQAAAPAVEAPTPAPTTAQAPQSQQPQAKKPAQNSGQTAQEIPKAPEENEQSADGLLVQGSVNNAATSQYATNPAFGNTRSGSRGLYTGGFQINESNSALNAQPYSLSGVPTSKPSWNDFTGVAVLQGPLRIPHILPRGPNFTLIYQWTRNSNATTLQGIVPTTQQRMGNLAGLTNSLGQPVTIYYPGTNTVNLSQQVTVSPQAAALLCLPSPTGGCTNLYPMPNITSASAYNYQAPVLNDTHQDSMQSRFDRSVGRKDSFNGRFAFQSTRSGSVNLFNFVDQTGTLGINANVQWSHRLKPRVFLYTTYTFSRLRSEVTPNFAYRENVSGQAGIQAWVPGNLQSPGSLQDPADWGPPALSFGDGTAGLSDGNSSFNRNRNDDVAVSTLIYHGKHNITAGVEFNKREYNDDFQQDPRGTFNFTGAATQGSCTNPSICGSALADFLLGLPDTSQIAFGNANKYFREPVYDAYINDDWRVMPILTINAGLRWDYGAPMTELFGNLVNLDVAGGFTQAGAVVANNPVGPVTGNRYPNSLIEPDRRMIEPRIGVTWRPIPASTVVIKAGYGLYPDTSVYQNIVLNMAQQAPLSKSQNVDNSTACPLTLANGFTPCSAVTSDTFGIDPNFRIGYAQDWQLSVQRDMPFALQLTATYSGIKGTHGPQEILPNSYPLGTANPCPSCPAGFVYETSNGNSIHEAGGLQLRRRLRSGFAASLSYTYAKSIDDDAYLGGVGHQTAGSGGSAQSASLSTPTSAIAQNWLDPRAERSLSGFDQRQLVNLTAQYTSGQGLEGGTLMGGWRGRALKEWTVVGNLTYGTGSPETPLYPSAVPGTGFANIIRPDLTGTSIYNSGTAAHLNAAAYSEPIGNWGTAGRNSIEGPSQFTLNSQMARTFRPHGKWYLDVAVSANNTFNHVTFTNWNNVVTSDQFGLPSSPGGMRSLQTSFHLRWQ